MRKGIIKKTKPLLLFLFSFLFSFSRSPSHSHWSGWEGFLAAYVLVILVGLGPLRRALSNNSSLFRCLFLLLSLGAFYPWAPLSPPFPLSLFPEANAARMTFVSLGVTLDLLVSFSVWWSSLPDRRDRSAWGYFFGWVILLSFFFSFFFLSFYSVYVIQFVDLVDCEIGVDHTEPHHSLEGPHHLCCHCPHLGRFHFELWGTFILFFLSLSHSFTLIIWWLRI